MFWSTFYVLVCILSTFCSTFYVLVYLQDYALVYNLIYVLLYILSTFCPTFYGLVFVLVHILCCGLIPLAWVFQTEQLWHQEKTTAACKLHFLFGCYYYYYFFLQQKAQTCSSCYLAFSCVLLMCPRASPKHRQSLCTRSAPLSPAWLCFLHRHCRKQCYLCLHQSYCSSSQKYRGRCTQGFHRCVHIPSSSFFTLTPSCPSTLTVPHTRVSEPNYTSLQTDQSVRLQNSLSVLVYTMWDILPVRSINIWLIYSLLERTQQPPREAQVMSKSVSYRRDEWGKKWKSLLKAPLSMYCSDTEQSVQRAGPYLISQQQKRLSARKNAAREPEVNHNCFVSREILVTSKIEHTARW